MRDPSTLDDLFAERARQDDSTAVEIRRGVERRLFGELPPLRVLGRLVVGGRVGKGAQGEIRRAHDPLLQRDVAVKLLHRGVSMHPDARSRLRREALALAASAHPNVVSLYDVAIVDDMLFVVMELVDGRDLATWLSERQRGWRQVVGLFAELAEGLGAVHRWGLVHRDVKPTNVLVDRSGRPRLADFGLSTLAARLPEPTDDACDVADDLRHGLTRTGVVVGTPAYMAPEQHEHGPIDARADQYAFFVALWEALYGARPFVARDVATLARLKHRGPPRIDDRRGVPRRVHAVIERGLRADPAARHADMSAAAAALRRAASRRDRTIAAGGGLLVAFVAIALWPGAAPCNTGSTRAADRWRARRQEVQASFAETALPYAATTFRQVDVDVEAWTQTWASAWARACADERSSGSAAAASQMRCLDAQLRDLEVLGDVLVAADPRFVASAVEAAQALPPVSGCGDAPSHVPDPRAADPAAAEDVRRLIGRARHLVRAAMPDEAADALADARGRLVVADSEPLALELELAETELALLRSADADALARMEGLAWRASAADRPDIAVDAMLALAGAYAGERAAGRADEGLQWITRMDPLIASVPDPIPDVRRRLYHAALAGYQGDYATKLALAQSVLDLPVDVLPQSSHLRAQAWSNLGTALRLSGRLDEARRAYEEALGHQRETLGPHHPATLAALTGLANIALVQRESATAEDLLEQALELATTAWGEQDIRAVRLRGDLGNVAFLREDYARALFHYEGEHRVLEDTLGADHSNTAHAAVNRAYALSLLDRFEEAEPYFRDAIAVFAEGGEHPDQLAGARQRYGDALLAAGRIDDARALFEAALRGATDLGRSPDLVAALGGLARAASASGDPATAAAHQREIVQLRANASATSRAVARVNLAMSLVELGQLDEARALVDEAEPLLHDPDDPLAARVLAGIAELRAGPLRGPAIENAPAATGPDARSSSSDRAPRRRAAAPP